MIILKIIGKLFCGFLVLGLVNEAFADYERWPMYVFLAVLFFIPVFRDVVALLNKLLSYIRAKGSARIEMNRLQRETEEQNKVRMAEYEEKLLQEAEDKRKKALEEEGRLRIFNDAKLCLAEHNWNGYLEYANSNLQDSKTAAKKAYDEFVTECETSIVKKMNKCSGSVILEIEREIDFLNRITSGSVKEKWEKRLQQVNRIMPYVQGYTKSAVLSGNSINENYLNELRDRDLLEERQKVRRLAQAFSQYQGMEYLSIDLDGVIDLIWYFTIREPFDSISYENVSSVYNYYTERNGQECLDLLLSELYIYKVHKKDKIIDYSAFMHWLKDQTENGGGEFVNKIIIWNHWLDTMAQDNLDREEYKDA